MDINKPVPKTVPKTVNPVKNILEWAKPEFLKAKEMGIQCAVQPLLQCSNCADCSISAHRLTRKDQAKLLLIEQNMRVATKKKRTVVKHLVVKDPSVLSNNYQQAVKMASSLEMRLKRVNMLDQYNLCMQEFINRPWEIPREVLVAWTGPLNYISHHPVLKPGSLSIHLQIFSNSSLNNNGSGYS